VSSSEPKTFSKIKAQDSRYPRLLCNQADFALTVGGNFWLALDRAVSHILPINQNIKSELRKHRIIIVAGGIDPSDIGLTKWRELR
jgi:hypothetical protein